MHWDTPATRALTVVAIGLLLVWWGLRELDIRLTLAVLAKYVIVPIGGVCVAAGVWSLAAWYIDD